VVAVALSFDYQMGTVYDDKNPAADVNTNSQYDGRVGLPRILRVLDKYKGAGFFLHHGCHGRLLSGDAATDHGQRASPNRGAWLDS
jgi:hypothetical protein